MRRRVILAGLALSSAAAVSLFAAWPAGPVAGRPLPAIPRLDRPLRLAVIGTSLTSRYDWPEQLAAILSGCLPQPIALHRFAEAGRGSAWGIQAAAAARRFAPDLVLIEFLANDADISRLRTVAASRANHRRIIAALQTGGARPAIALVLTNPAAGLRGALRWRLARFNAMYGALAAELDLGLVDTVPRWRHLLQESPQAAILPDGLHPSAEWQSRIMLAELVPALARALADAYPECRHLAG